MTAPPGFLRPGTDAVIIEVHVQPGARRAGITGVHDSALKIAVREKAQRGTANDAVRSLIARILGVSPSSVVVTSGQRSRRKRITVHGIDMATAVGRIQIPPGGGVERKSPS